jgi:glucan 1,3-beta-glucosidase
MHGLAYRNVKSYGAKGDGVTDDTAAINAALTQGRTPAQTTKDPAVIYLPAGTYVVTQSLPLWFYTHIVGNPLPGCETVLLVPSGTYTGGRNYVLNADLSDAGDHDDEFYRAVMNIKIVIQPNNPGAAGIHWAVSQATQLRQVSIEMGPDAAMGIFGENGSGGYISDLFVSGGIIGIAFGNQQWFWANVTVTNSVQTCISMYWDWVFSFVNLQTSNCPVGIDFQGGAQGSLMLLDSTMSNHTTAVMTDYPKTPTNILFERTNFINTAVITPGVNGNSQGTVNVPAWVQGPRYVKGVLQSSNQTMVPLTRPDAPLEYRPRPIFGENGASVANVYSYGAKGDGVTDDTKALQAAITANAQVFLPAGSYLVSGPITLRADTSLVGEVMSILLAQGGAAAWADVANPQPLLYAPPGSAVRVADLLFSATGDVPGLIFIDWNSNSSSGIWDTHWRLEHTAHTLVRIGADDAGAGGFFANMWGWVADHDIDGGGGNITVLNPRGFEVRSQGATYFYGTAAEHSYLSQYNFSGASNVTAIVMQTESPYWQSPPTALALNLQNVDNMHIYGTGFYNWFQGEYKSNCLFLSRMPHARHLDARTALGRLSHPLSCLSCYLQATRACS